MDRELRCAVQPPEWPVPSCWPALGDCSPSDDGLSIGRSFDYSRRTTHAFGATHVQFRLGCPENRGSKRLELSMNVNSEETWINAASKGLIIPIAANAIPSVSTTSVP